MYKVLQTSHRTHLFQEHVLQTLLGMGMSMNVTASTANLRANIMDFGGFYLSIILILRGGIPRLIGNFLESLSPAILVGIILVGRLGVLPIFPWRNSIGAMQRDPHPQKSDLIN